MRRLLATISLVIITLGCVCQTEIDFIELDNFVETVMKDWGVPGVAVSIVKGDEVIHQKGYGFENLNSKKAVTAQSLFSIASSTKSFTATSAAILAERGIVSFKKPLIKNFPDFRLYDELATQKVTLEDLLTHRTGIPRQKFFSLNTPETRIGVRKSFAFFEPSRDFRSEFQYCNESYTVAGDMIAELADLRWEELIQKEILTPLEMNSTLFSVHSLDKSASFASPYIDWDGYPEEMDLHDADILGPAGCIISNVEDLSNWLLFNLSNGNYKGNQILSERTHSQLYTPRIIATTSQASSELTHQSYGLGWFIDYYKGFRHIHHGGVLYGYSSQVSFLPEEGIGIVVLANLNGTVITRIIELYIYDLLLGKEVTDWNGRYLARRDAYREYVESMESRAEKSDSIVIESGVPYKELTGQYKSDGYGSFEVYYRDDTLRTKLMGYECSFIPNGDKTLSLYHPVEHQGWPVTAISSNERAILSLSVEVNPGLKGIVFSKLQ